VISATQNVISATDDQIEHQKHMECATRFLVRSYIPYDGKLDVKEYIDLGIFELAENEISEETRGRFRDTFQILYNAFGENALRRIDSDKHTGKGGLVAFECIAVGLGGNITAIHKLSKPIG
jgi:hypothetical protein